LGAFSVTLYRGFVGLHRTGRAGRARRLQVRGPFGLPCGARSLGARATTRPAGSDTSRFPPPSPCAPQPRTGAPEPTPRTPRSLALKRFARASRRCDNSHCRRKSGGSKPLREVSGGCVAGVRGRLCAAEERRDRRKKKRACLSRRRVCALPAWHEHRKEARRACALEAPGPPPHARRVASPKLTKPTSLRTPRTTPPETS